LKILLVVTFWNIEPPSAAFPASGGNSQHNLVSLSDSRLAFKVSLLLSKRSQVKSSNNNDYRVNPVYGFLEPKANVALEILRTTGQAKQDKLVVQWAEVPAEV